LFPEPGFHTLAILHFVLRADGFIVGMPSGYHVIENARQFVRGGGDGLDPDHRGNGLRKLAHSPTIEVALFPASLRADARELIREWKEFSEKQQKRENSINPEVKALRERILEHKNEEVQWYNKKSDSGGRGTIVDCDEEVAILRVGQNDPFTYQLVDLDTTKKYLNGQMQFVLVFKNR